MIDMKCIDACFLCSHTNSLILFKPTLFLLHPRWIWWVWLHTNIVYWIGKINVKMPYNISSDNIQYLTISSSDLYYKVTKIAWEIILCQCEVIIFRECLNHLTIDISAFQTVFTCSKLTKETLEQDVKYVQS